MKDNIGSFYLPPVAGADAAAHDQLFDFILYLSTFFFLLICGLIVVFVVKYRRRAGENRKTSPIEGNQQLEIIWSVVPAILLVVMFDWGFKDWLHMNVAPAESIDIRVLGKKWNWEFDYPKDGIQAAAELVVPVNKPVKLTMSAVDVLHSLYIPAFRVKRDVLPNRYSVLWFEATKLGTFDIYCAEYCGTSHSQMITRVKVVTDQEYKAFLEGGGGMDKLPPLELGKKLFVSRGCTACHSLTRDRMGLPGPPMAGKFGTMEKLKEGPDVKIDEDYIRESILEPNAKIVAGYEPVMPTFKGRLNDRQLNGIIDYIKSLK